MKYNYRDYYRLSQIKFSDLQVGTELLCVHYRQCRKHESGVFVVKDRPNTTDVTLMNFVGDVIQVPPKMKLCVDVEGLFQLKYQCSTLWESAAFTTTCFIPLHSDMVVSDVDWFEAVLAGRTKELTYVLRSKYNIWCERKRQHTNNKQPSLGGDIE